MQQAHILVVEDRADWQTIMQRTLKGAGYHPTLVASYAEARAALQQHSFALAVVDPVLDIHNRFNRDGLSVIQAIRAVQPLLPVVVVTGSLTRDMQTSLHQLCPGAPVLLKESWEPQAFTELVDSLLAEHHPGIAAGMGMAIPGTTDEAPLVPPPIEQRAPGCPRVLLVENRPDWQVIVARVLDSAGYFWRLAPTAQAALRELEQESFHLVILDLKLQENDLPLTSSEGWLLLDYLVGSRPATSIVIVSGEARPADVADLLMHYPVVGFIEKQQFTPQAIIDAVAQATRAPALHLQMLGTFRVWRDDQAIVIWERPQAETVVKMLLARRIQGGRVVAADELMTRLWPDTDEENGRKKLLPLISNARRTLEPGIEPRDSHFIVRSSGGYFFDLGGSVVCDVLTFREHLRAGRQLADEMRPEAAIAELEKARTLYQGDFLEEDYYVDWAIDLRRDIVGELCDGLIVLSDCYATLRQYEAAIDACELVVRKDPLQELVYRRLMCLHFCNGDKARALKVHRDCITLFEELFGERPSPITHALYEAIARDDASACDMAHWASG